MDYLDEYAHCPKCGHAIVKMHYHAAEDKGYTDGDVCEEANNEEHMDRECERCFYQWVERVLGTKVK